VYCASNRNNRLKIQVVAKWVVTLQYDTNVWNGHTATIIRKLTYNTITRCHNPGACDFNLHCRENRNSRINIYHISYVKRFRIGGLSYIIWYVSEYLVGAMMCEVWAVISGKWFGKYCGLISV